MSNIGKLTIFTSYTPGAGKTYMMLSRAIKQQDEGKKIVVGFINGSHRNISDLHNIAVDENQTVKRTKYSIRHIISQKPDIVLMDEMGMHSKNVDVRQSTLKKRFLYEDIYRLLQEGIDVYATANLKKFKDVNPLFAEVTGIKVKNTIPTQFLEMADQIVFVDREPEIMKADYESKNLFKERYNDSHIMNKNFKLETLESYRQVSIDYLTENFSEVLEMATREEADNEK